MIRKKKPEASSNNSEIKENDEPHEEKDSVS
jgi:hypothetical protein